MATDDWVEAAMTDDTMVVELLLRLKQQSQPSLPPKPQVLAPFKWGHRRRRTKVLSSTTARFEKKVEGGDLARGSPTTPLSWSGGAGGGSACPSGDGSEESSRFNSRCVSSNRSKATVLNDSNNTTATTSKSSKRKQTFARLEEHKTILLKESVHLKKEISTMHTPFVEQRAENENLKRTKLDFGLQSLSNGTIADKPKDTVIASTSTSLLPVAGNHLSASGSRQLSNGESSQQDRGFLLPDLNMMPSEEDSASETTLYGTS